MSSVERASPFAGTNFSLDSFEKFQPGFMKVQNNAKLSSILVAISLARWFGGEVTRYQL